MSINIFDLASCQPLVWVALALVTLLGIPNIFLYRELSLRYCPEEKKRFKIFNWVLSVAIVVLWAIVVVANHTTVWQDIVNFAFLIGFSFVFMFVAAIALMIAISVIVCVLMTLYYMILCVMALFGKLDNDEDFDIM